MANYLTDTTNSVFGDRRVVFGTIVMDDSNTGLGVFTGLTKINYADVSPNTGGSYKPHWTDSSGYLAITTAASASSFRVMIIGR